MNEEFIKRAVNIKLLLMDCDGVLTDGRLYYSVNGEELKVFHVRDGQGIVLWHEAGFQSGIISGRNSPIVERRAKELGMKFIKQGSMAKNQEFNEILEESRLKVEEIAFIGDDIADICILNRVGLSFAVADAEAEVLASASFLIQRKGGQGAVREAINTMLSAKNKQ